MKDWLTQDGPTFVEVEEMVSSILRENFTFSCFRADQQMERLALERGLIALLAQFSSNKKSTNWLGRYAADEKIIRTGLWNTQHIDSEPLIFEEFQKFEKLIACKQA